VLELTEGWDLDESLVILLATALQVRQGSQRAAPGDVEAEHLLLIVHDRSSTLCNVQDLLAVSALSVVWVAVPQIACFKYRLLRRVISNRC
jgi:hypothetical protein